MKKYKLLKDVFNQEAGTIFEAEEGEYIQIQENMVAITFVNPEAHPELFKEVEEIKEPSDEEVIVKYLSSFVPSQTTPESYWREADHYLARGFRKIASDLLKKGFDVSKLREGK